MAPSDKMFTYKNAVIILMVCISLGLQYSACLAQEARIISFKEPIPNKAMEGHVINREEVPNEGSCRVMCFMEPNCVSINMGPLKGGKLKCELNNATDENEFAPALKNRAAHTYLAVENPCSSRPCFNNGTCQAGFTSEGHRCKCLPGFPGTNCRAAKSCSDIKRLDPSAENGSYIIDPDGEGGLPPLHNITCDMSDKNGVGVTVISHDSESRTLVDGCEKPGCYSRDIHYTGASLSELESLTRVSSHCEQFIKYECYHSCLHYKDDPFGWWVSRNATKMTYWSGASPDSGNCTCGMNNTCANRKLGCNCDKNDKEWREDSGLLTNKSHLPVTQLRFGDIGKEDNYDEMGYHTLGKLKCFDIA